VKISGVKSEFSVLAGVREDVLELLLNLKQVKFRGLVDSPFFTRMEVQGPSIVTTSSLRLPSDVHVLNSSQYILTISDSINLELELKIESGIGYRKIDPSLKSSSNDFLMIDANFTPIKKVNFDMEDSYKIGEDGTETLRLEITTDGSLTPEDALNKATEISQTLFGSLLVDESTTVLPVKEEDKMDVSIENLELSVRAYNCLKSANIQTIADLRDYSVKDLKKIKNFGKKSAMEVVEKLQDRFGLCLN
jgi:DNA-directed RNA polymerase subunit alpha